MPVKVWPFGACSSWAGPVQWEGTGPGGGGRPTCECPAGASEVWPPAQPGGHASGMREEHREVASREDSAQPLVLPLLFSAEPAQVAEAHASGFLLVWQDVEGNGEGDQWLSTSPVGLMDMDEQQALAVAASLSAAVAPLELHLVTGVVDMHPAYRIHVLSTFWVLEQILFMSCLAPPQRFFCQGWCRIVFLFRREIHSWCNHLINGVEDVRCEHRICCREL